METSSEDKTSEAKPKKPLPHPQVLRFRCAMVLLIQYFKLNKLVSRPTLRSASDRVLNDLLEESNRDESIKSHLGHDKRFWYDITELLVFSLPSIQNRVFEPEDLKELKYDRIPGVKLLQNARSLIEDITRLNRVISIARNVLVSGRVAKSLMAHAYTDKALAELMQIAMQVSCGSYVPPHSTRDEEQTWRHVITFLKKLLITAFQVFNNFCVNNQYGLLSFWLLHIDTKTDQLGKLTEWIRKVQTTGWEPEELDLLALAIDKAKELAATSFSAAIVPIDDPRFKEHCTYKAPKSPNDQDPVAYSSQRFFLFFDKSHHLLNICPEEFVEPLYQKIQSMSPVQYSGPSPKDPDFWNGEHLDVKGFCLIPVENLSFTTHFCIQEGLWSRAWKTESGTLYSEDVTIGDLRRHLSPQFAADDLNHRKDKILRALESLRSPTDSSTTIVQAGTSFRGAVEEPYSPEKPKDGIFGRLAALSPTPILTPHVLAHAPFSTEEQVGLFTDTPVILGPGEVEVLPLIIEAGIATLDEAERQKSSKTEEEIRLSDELARLRCQLLLTTTAGRDLLRELLIYVAAWEPADLYYGLMERILRSLLRENMVVYAWDCLVKNRRDFEHSEQVVMIRLLTAYFSTRWEVTEGTLAHADPETRSRINVSTEPYPTPNERLTINVFMSQFRRAVIPQALVLILIQGLVGMGQMAVDEFPYAYWELERKYESLCSYLLFFKAVCKSPVLKYDLTNWVIIQELTELLNMLHEMIPRSGTRRRGSDDGGGKEGGDVRKPNAPGVDDEESVAAAADARPAADRPRAPVSVERPYDVTVPDADTSAPAKEAEDRPESDGDGDGAEEEEEEREAHRFEWRDIKLLAVELIHSLAFENIAIRQQIVAKDDPGQMAPGVRALLSCCFPDDPNPYLPQAARAALRLLVHDQNRLSALLGDLAG